MKHSGSISQTYIERNRVIIKLYMIAKAKVSWPATVPKICKYVSSMPTKEHFISDNSALEYVRKRYVHNIETKFRSSYKQRLYDHYYNVFLNMLKKEKYQKMKITEVALLALSRPACCCGLPPAAIQQIVHKYFKKTIMTRLLFSILFCLLMLILIPYSEHFAVSSSSSLCTHFIYMFGHASFIHWLVNSWSVLVFHNTMHWYRLCLAYAFSVSVSFILPSSLPVIGFSVIISFFIGYILRYLYHKDRLAFYLTLAIVIIGIFLPNIAGFHHLAMVILGLISYYAERLIGSVYTFISS